MPLDEYRRKRDFARTTEPAPADAPRRDQGGGLLFCVQKHLASALHYDLRLEHEGVLLSWAVPKGPSIDPSVKRLAMQTEDHPCAYGDFEGIIPDGYGAGVVMLWDRGTWTPEVPDVAAALKKGDLKFRLEGYKLKGSWALVRTRGFGGRGGEGAGGRSWLLIKHKDEWGGPVDIAEFAPLSVKSGGDFADILGADLPAFWTSNPGVKTDASMLASLQKIVEKVAQLGPSRGRPPGRRGQPR
jgi:bifunctional non-homologous end joining protein LigD